MGEGRPNVVDMIKNREIDLVINTTEGKQAIKDSASIRRSGRIPAPITPPPLPPPPHCVWRCVLGNLNRCVVYKNCMRVLCNVISKFPMTVQGEQKLRDELRPPEKKVERPRIVQAIAEAREHGDLKENAEYHAAREQQSFL